MIRIVKYVAIAVLIISGLELANRWLVGLNSIRMYHMLVLLATGLHWAATEVNEIRSVVPPDVWDR
jgi:hypothetical protein